MAPPCTEDESQDDFGEIPNLDGNIIRYRGGYYVLSTWHCPAGCDDPAPHLHATSVRHALGLYDEGPDKPRGKVGG